jgi:predicted glycosyltransferase involved in capsule biosynthesis
MVYITVGSAAYPIQEFLDEWGTENFEVLVISCIKLICFVLCMLCINLLIFIHVGNFSCGDTPSYKNFRKWLLGGHSS